MMTECESIIKGKLSRYLSTQHKYEENKSLKNKMSWKCICAVEAKSMDVHCRYHALIATGGF